jgi:hypothetical protein
MSSKRNEARDITVVEVMALETLRSTLEMLRKRVRETEGVIEAMETDLLARMRAGARVRVGEGKVSHGR